VKAFVAIPPQFYKALSNAINHLLLPFAKTVHAVLRYGSNIILGKGSAKECAMAFGRLNGGA
jgi:hypothetical protein